MRAPRRWYVMLRVTWLGWLASLTWFFAHPVLWLLLPGVHRLVVIHRGAGGMCARPDCAPEPYLVQHADLTLSMVISEWTVWLPLLLAMVLPTVMHVRRRDRFGGPFSTSEVAETPHPASYRRAAPRVVGADARRLRILIHGFGVRVSVAMLLTLVPCLQLVGARFVKNYGCVSYTNVFSVPEYLTYVLLLLVVVLVHAPSERRVFGSASRSAV